LEDKKDLLKCDFVMISDGEITSGHPTIEAGFRGGFNTTLTVRTSDKELHSGLFGGAAPSASRELSKFLAQIHKEDNTVAIEGFYDDVDEISAQYKQMHNQIPFSEEEFKKLSGTQALLTEDQYDFYTQIGLRPAVIITGIQTGYMGEGYRNSIPSEASAKVNFRLVKSQEPEKISQLYCDFVDEHIPDYVDFDLRVESKYHGIKLDLENEYVQLAQEYLQKAFDKESFFKFCGGGLPIVTHFDEVLGVPEVLAPLANEDCAMHATNENYNKNVLKRALKFSKVFWSKS
jgi:acetylornithine deacetylase/succinyl-diaminopimelate desuccinylase-like protein